MTCSSWFAGFTIRLCARCGAHCWTPTCRDCLTVPASQWTTEAGHRVLSLGSYDDTPGRLVRALKFSDETLVAAHLGIALSQITPNEWKDFILLPAPLHPQRLAERGYNQSALLARSIARQTKMRVSFDSLSRQKQTLAQARLSAHSRADNLKDAFVARQSLKNKRIILVDDVVTTGHTIDECASALTRAGACIEGVLACALSRQSLS